MAEVTPMALLMLAGAGGSSGGGSGGGAPAPPGSNEARINSILAGRTIPFSMSYPADPVTTRGVTVNSVSEFNSEASVAGTLITIGSSFSGTVQITADDIDVVCSNALTITGDINFLGTTRNRVRWTGGNLNGWLNLARTVDALVDDLYITTPDSSSYNILAADGDDRHALINCTIEKTDGANINAWQLYTFNSANLYADTFIGNCLFTGSTTDDSCVRMQSAERIAIVDSVFNPLGNQIHGLRFHDGCQSVWIKDSWIRGDLKVDVIGSPTNPNLPNCGNATFDSLTVYNTGSSLFQNFTDSFPQGNTQNSGTCIDCVYRPEGPYGSFTLPTGFTDGGGNSETVWDGVTLPSYTTVGAIR